MKKILILFIVLVAATHAKAEDKAIRTFNCSGTLILADTTKEAFALSGTLTDLSTATTLSDYYYSVLELKTAKGVARPLAIKADSVGVESDPQEVRDAGELPKGQPGLSFYVETSGVFSKCTFENGECIGGLSPTGEQRDQSIRTYNASIGVGNALQGVLTCKLQK